MKEYLLLIRQDGDPLEKASPEVQQSHVEKFAAYIRQLLKAGKLKSAQPLEGEGKVVSGNGGVVKDGPFNESKEVVAGYFLVLAEDINEAVKIASGNPVFRDNSASIEIRPIRKLEGIN